MAIFRRMSIIQLIVIISINISSAQTVKTGINFTVTMEQPATHYYHVTMQCTQAMPEKAEFKMCAWTPGYYQLLDYAKALENFKAVDATGKTLAWEKPAPNTWRVNNSGRSPITVSYDIKATTSFVANVYLDEHRGYITPGGLFLYSESALRKPVSIQIKPFAKWPDIVATGLDTIAGKYHTFFTPDFDVLYDSPFLLGELEQLPTFTVDGAPHYFIAYQPGKFDQAQFITDLEKIVRSSVAIIGDIPYSNYSFLGIGPGQGGIEHLNSTSLSFNGNESFNSPEARKRTYSFIAHEYFHHYNVKRIRPIELGPFDYSKENRTNMLWVSEGFTVYYEYLVLKRAGLITAGDVLSYLQSNIKEYENKPGHLFQSATQASYETWSDGPFGRTGDEVNKTISYYDKGPILGLMLDFAIRNATGNRKSLDDVMRLLYKKYYRQQNRGFHEKEFQRECEKIAGRSLQELFEYASTVKSIDYPKYFGYAGLTIDTTSYELPGSWLGINTRFKDSALIITNVDWNSPAWNIGIRSNQKILTINGKKASKEILEKLALSNAVGDTISLLVQKDNKQQQLQLITSKKHEKSFTITQVPNPTPLQSAIYNSWLAENTYVDKTKKQRR